MWRKEAAWDEKLPKSVLVQDPFNKFQQYIRDYHVSFKDVELLCHSVNVQLL